MVGVNRDPLPGVGTLTQSSVSVTALDYRVCKTQEPAGDCLARTSERVKGTLKGYERGELFAAEVAGCYAIDL